MKLSISHQNSSQKQPKVSPQINTSGKRSSQKLGSPKTQQMCTSFSSSQKTATTSNYASVIKDVQIKDDKQTLLLKQEIAQLTLQIEEAQQREIKQRDMYEHMLEALHQEPTVYKQDSKLFSVSDDMLNQSEQMKDDIILKDLQNQLEQYKDEINKLKHSLEECQRKLINAENTLKLSQKDQEYSLKNLQTQVNHLKLENDRLRDQLQNEKDRNANEHQLELEELLDSQKIEIQNISERYEQQLSDLKHMHWSEKAKLQEETDRARTDLRMLRLEHSELISNTNVGDQLQNLHDQYLHEIQALNEKLLSKNEETQQLIQTLEREREILVKKIDSLEVDVKSEKTQREKEKKEYTKKSKELREKLDKAFQQLTFNDEAATELSKLRTQIKDMQSKAMVRSRSKSNFESQKEMESANTKATVLQKQIGALKDENQKLKKELKVQLQRARSASPPFARQNQSYQEEQQINDSMAVKSKGFRSPKEASSKEIQQTYYQKQSKVRTFLNSQKMKLNALNDINVSAVEHDTGSNRSTPNNAFQKKTIFQQPNTSRVLSIQKAVQDSQAHTERKEIIAYSLNPVNPESSSNKKNIQQSLSSSHLISSPKGSLQLLQQQIEHIKCSQCQNMFDYLTFFDHTQSCKLERLIDDDLENLTCISPIKGRNELKRINSIQDKHAKNNSIFQRPRGPLQGDSYVDEECSTEAGFKSQYLGNVQARPSFLSSVDYNSFMVRNGDFSPETLERNGTQQVLMTQEKVAMQNISVQEKHLIEEKVRFYESMFRQSQENNQKLYRELRQKDIENERLINQLKSSKIHIALLEEQTAQTEFALKNEIHGLKSARSTEKQPEIVVDLHTTNVTCFNFGSAQVTNSHEIRIDPKNFLQKAANDVKKTVAPAAKAMQTPQTHKGKAQDLSHGSSIYQETAPSMTYRKNDRVDDSMRAPPKRLRSFEKETSSSVYSHQSPNHMFCQSFATNQDLNDMVSPQYKKGGYKSPQRQ